MTGKPQKHSAFRKVSSVSAASLLTAGALLGASSELSDAPLTPVTIDMADAAPMLDENQTQIFDYLAALPPESRVVEVSVVTQDERLSKVADLAHNLPYDRYRLSPGDHRAAPPESLEAIRRYYDTFSEVTGIRVNVTENDPSAHIVIAGASNEKARASGWGGYQTYFPTTPPKPPEN